MKQRVIVSIVAFAIVLLSGLAVTSASTRNTGGNAASRAYLHSYNLPSSGIALEGYCPVAYFAVNKAVRGKPEFSSTYNDVTYHFVSADAKRMFEADPEKFVPAYGGWCAFGMSVQDKFPVDPRNFKIVNGKLMLFLRNQNVDALALWNAGNEAELIRKADAHWQTVAN